MQINNESKTLFIPLLGKAQMSKKNLFLHDPKAEEIVSKIEFNFHSLKQSKWLSMYMSLRGLLIDELCNDYLCKNPSLTIIHLGCGLDSRCLRINNYSMWYDIDYENVIEIRKEFYEEKDNYKMIGTSVMDFKWLDKIANQDNILIVMEGLTMYLSESEIIKLIDQINNKFNNVHFIFDAYTKKAIRYSKIKNPVNKLGAKLKYGFDNYEEFLKLNNNLVFIKEHAIIKKESNLTGLTKFIFNNIYCSKLSENLYKIYEFKLEMHLEKR